MHDVIEALNRMPLASLMLVVAVGYTVGRVAWRGVSLGPAGGTMATAILLGVAGLDLGPHGLGRETTLSLGAFGFALFIYSVGFEAGPRFFGSLAGGPGWRFVVVGVVVNLAAFVLALLLGSLLGLGGDVTAGILAGGVTSAPTYAAALEGVLRRGGDVGALTISFALTYPVGLLGLVVLIQSLPRLRGVDLTAEAEALEEAGRPRSVAGREFTRAFRVAIADATGRPLAELDLPRRTGAYITRVHRGDEVLAPHAGLALALGDHVLVRGRLEELAELSRLVGPEIEDRELAERMPTPRRVVVQATHVVGRTLRELALPDRHGVFVLNVERGRVEVEATADLVLERGDVLALAGRRIDVRQAARRIGRLERPTHETDIAVYAGGIFLGLLLGGLHLRGGGVDVTLGYAGGLLLAGLVLGRLPRIGPLSTHVPRAARQLVRDLGILLFIAEAGLLAAQSPLGRLEGRVLPVLLAGLVVAVVPALIALAVARRTLRLRPLEAWGSVSGGLTSSAALATLQRVTDDNAPALSYAAAYALASVLATIAGQVVVYVMA